MAKYTILTSKSTNTGTWYRFAGNAEDKPTGGWIGLNSEYFENDTGLTKYWVGGETPWATQATRGGGSGGGSLPANFPAEGEANANKYVGFDENGDYAALEAPEGGDSLPSMTGKAGKVLGVTLNQSDEPQAEWVDAKTPLVISEFTPDPEDQTKLICNYTSQQLYDVMRTGRNVVGSFGEGAGSMVIPFVGAYQYSATTVLFYVPDFAEGSLQAWERVLADSFWISAE